MVLIPFEIKTTNKGKGVFANRHIHKSEIVWRRDPSPKTFTQEEYEKLDNDQKQYIYQEGDRYIFDNEQDDRWNHSCNANKWWADDPTLCARRNISIDEELTYDYVTSDIDKSMGTSSWKCLCNEQNCRKYIGWNDILNLSLYNEYRGHLPSWTEEFVKLNQNTN